jgi:hypothetical protein
MTIPERASAQQARPALRRVHEKLERQIGGLAELAAGPPQVLQSRAEAVSGWSVAEHLEHLVRIDNGILDRIDRLAAGTAEPPSKPVPPLNLIGRLILLCGLIPRGRGKAPEAVRPQGMEVAELRAGIAGLGERFHSLGPRLPELAALQGTFRHPYFGGLSPVQWLRFMDIHHHHHLKIVRDVLRGLGVAR